MSEFEYKIIDFIHAQIGWLEAKLNNRLSEGYKIWFDIERDSWRGYKSN